MPHSVTLYRKKKGNGKQPAFRASRHYALTLKRTGAAFVVMPFAGSIVMYCSLNPLRVLWRAALPRLLVVLRVNLTCTLTCSSILYTFTPPPAGMRCHSQLCQFLYASRAIVDGRAVTFVVPIPLPFPVPACGAVSFIRPAILLCSTACSGGI